MDQSLWCAVQISVMIMASNSRCTHVNLAVGVYSSKLLMSAMASGAVRGLKTFVNGWGLIWGNLCSMY